MPSQQSNYLRHIMTTLWANWIVAAGALALELILPRLMSKEWLPLPILILAYLVTYYRRMQQDMRGTGDLAILRVSSMTLFWSAIVMLVINILNSRMLLDGMINWSNSNREIPYITCLVMFPVLTIMCLWVMSWGYMQNMAEGYRAKSGILPGNGAVATLLSVETRFQVRSMLYVSIALNIVEWWYYFVYYINTNMNHPDVFFFNWMPVTLFILSLFFMASRYKSLAAMVGPIAINSRENGTTVRFILISGDKILLSPDHFGRFDTPAITSIGTLDAHNEKAVKEAFERISGTADFKLRYLYETSIPGEVEILHYAVFLPEEFSSENWKEGQWMTIDAIDRLIKSAGMSAEFTDEMFRIFTITLTWKTYDTAGRRIYPIKNYRPSFRIRDMKDWDVDYSDIRWLDIAKHNQDRPFYRAHKLWRKITGFKV